MIAAPPECLVASCFGVGPERLRELEPHAVGIKAIHSPVTGIVDYRQVVAAYARQVMIVPGYGLAVAQAQHAVRELCDLLEARGVTVKYAIHPVAGRMPGHMNVLLAEANVPYPQLLDMEDANPELVRTDVALVIGANDVTNPAARTNRDSPLYGMPILDVDKAQNVVMAIRPGGSGDVSESHVRWRYDRHVPFCASPVMANGVVFGVKDGGILTTLDSATGKPVKTGRLSGNGQYYASPVVADGRVFLLDQDGKLSVVTAAGEWEELQTADFGEQVYATPAIVDGQMYLRTAGHLYCFGAPEVATVQSK